MLFDSTLRKDLARTFGATLVVILTIVLTMMLIRTLGLAAGGKVSPQDVVLLLGYTALGHLPTMLNLSLFIAVVATLGRMYRDSEMAIWFASGAGLSRFVRPVLRMSWPVLAVVLVLVFFVWPWGNRNSADLRHPERPARLTAIEDVDVVLVPATPALLDDPELCPDELRVHPREEVAQRSARGNPTALSQLRIFHR